MGSGQYKIEVADNNYWRSLIKCQWGCPVYTDARGYVIAIGEGRYLDAYKHARGPNPFASMCGRVCGAPCEVACRRGSIDEPITIRALKRFVTEKFGVETLDPASTIQYSTARRDPDNPKAGTKVAIIGAGVGGLTAAHDLALLGYKVTVFESHDVAGGMMVTGVPLYRLDRELVQFEIDAILSMGIELKLNTEVGKDITINEMKKQGFEAILIAVGLQNSRNLPIPGVELEGVKHGIEFLKYVNIGQPGKPTEIGEKVIVIGGGNVAFDVARSAVRKQKGAYTGIEEFYAAADSARTALRQGAKEVHMVCLESLEEMPADDIEIEEGLEEGMILHTSLGPVSIEGKDGKVTGLKTRKVKSVFDETGRFNPTFVEGSEEIMDADTIILAIGQSTDVTFLKDAPEVAMRPNGIVDIDDEAKTTNIPGIFACGDVADGAKLFIDAIASAQRAAISIDEYIRGQDGTHTVRGDNELPAKHVMSDRYIQMDRENPPFKERIKRSGTVETIELSYEEQVAQEQGERCLKCHINTIFNGSTCILCNGCVDVCPTHCLKLVSLADLELDEEQESLINNRYNIVLKDIPEKERRETLDKIGSAMLKDEELCIRCGYCAHRCPTDAVTMEWFSYKECFTY